MRAEIGARAAEPLPALADVVGRHRPGAEVELNDAPELLDEVHPAVPASFAFAAAASCFSSSAKRTRARGAARAKKRCLQLAEPLRQLEVLRYRGRSEIAAGGSAASARSSTCSAWRRSASEALEERARSGAAITLLVRYPRATLFETLRGLVRAGVKVLGVSAWLHAKAIVADGERDLVMTANLEASRTRRLGVRVERPVRLDEHPGPEIARELQGGEHDLVVLGCSNGDDLGGRWASSARRSRCWSRGAESRRSS